MGAPSGQNQSAYPTAGSVMQRARAFVNDAFRGGSGRILTDQAPFSTQFLNAALEELQDKIGNNGVITLTRDNYILTPLGALAGPDPAVQTWIGYDGFYDGVNLNPLPNLPSDCVAVEELWERQLGSGLPFKPMTQPIEGLPSILQGPWLNIWEYRADKIYMTGSTQTEELRMRYQCRQVPIAPEDASSLDDVQISILASVNALATLVAYNYARARGAQQAEIMAADCDKMMRYIVRRYTRRSQRVVRQRRAYGEAGDRRGVRLPF